MQSGCQVRRIPGGPRAVVLRQQRQLNTGEVRGGRPHPRGFRPADAHRVHQHDLYTAVDHRARQIVRRMAMGGYRKWRCAKSEDMARVAQVGTRIGDVGELQSPTGRTK
jgi:hypothetical protein